MTDAAARDSADFDEFIYHVSHDVRAGLRAISILPGWILEDLQKDNVRLNADVLKNFQLLTEQTQRIDRLLLDLRDYSRLGRISDEVCSVQLSDALDEAVIKVYGLGHFELAHNLGDLSIKCAQNELVTALYNLISNTLVHGERPKPSILIAANLDETHLKVSFEDNGVGIAPEYRKRVFGMLVSLHSRDERQGSGVGLASCRKVIEALGGTVELADPLVLSGARIEITLPASGVSGAPGEAG